jgi:hypothetical protein
MPFPFPVLNPGEEQRWAADRVLALSRNVAAKTLRQGEVEAFGKYLFETLLGEVLWKEMCIRADARGANQPIDLALCWDGSDRELGRLP